MATPEELTRSAVADLRAGRLAQAKARLEQVLQIQPNDAEALHLSGLVAYRERRFDDAIRWIERAIDVAPGRPHYHANLGNVLKDAGRPDRAIASYQTALECDPSQIGARNNLGVVLLAAGRIDEAAAHLRAVLAAAPDHFRAHFNLGNALVRSGDFDAAEASYRRALALDASFGEALGELGLLLQRMGRLRDAVDAFHRRVAVEPGNASAHADLALSLHQAGQFDAAAVSYERALAIAPDAIEVVCNFCGLMQRVCDWEQLAKWTPRVVQAIREGRPGVPLGLLVAQPRCSPELQLAAARANARDWDRTPAVAASPRSDHGRVRVGYLSADFREHATAWLTAELFELHDRADFDVALLSYGPDEPSAIRARLRNASDRFVDLHGFDDDAAARVVAELGLDVLVDLNGNTDNGRMGIVARRPAPVQVNWLGFPGTLGARCYDYMIADHHIVPDGCDRWYSEAVVRLPECYQCNDRLRSCPAESPPRAALGLPEAAVVLGCFNQAFKITPDMFSLWMRVLRAVPESVLWLLEDNAKATASLRSRASDAGVDPGRLAFAPRLGHQAHLQRYRAMDLALDTFPCTSHTTASDALWMDCPLITVTGDTFAARVATSLVRNAGVPELASPSLEDHERTVLALARAPDELRALRSRLHAGRFREPLFDTPRFVAHFETALRTMADRARAGLSPQAFAVPRRP